MKKGIQTRARILDEALRMASRTGLAGLSIGRLATAVGLSKSGLFAHIRSKENLQRMVLERTTEAFVEAVVRPAVDAPRGEPRLQALFENWIRWDTEGLLPGGDLFLSAAAELDDSGPTSVRSALVVTQREWLATLSETARRAVDEGHLDSSLDCEQFAYDFYSILLVYHLDHRLLKDVRAAERARKSCQSLLDRSRSGVMS